MPNRADKNKAKELDELMPQPHTLAPTYAILFQLEDVAINGRKIAYEILKKTLSEQRIDFPVHLFSRYCVDSTPQVYLPVLMEFLGTRQISAEQLVGKVTRAIAEEATAEGKLNVGLAKILQAARERNFAIGMISTWPEETGQVLLTKLGLDQYGARLFSFKDMGKIFPSADIWLKTAKAINIKPRRCLAVGGNMAVCKSAISADLRCLAVPDQFTAFQDYSGADLILDSLDGMSPKDILNTVFPHSDKMSGK